MKMFIIKLVPKLIFSIQLVIFVSFSISSSQADELLTSPPQSVNKFHYPSYSVHTLLSKNQSSSRELSSVNWLLNNSVVKDGIYSLEFKSGRKGQYGGGKPKGNGGVWENLSLKFSLDLLPKQYYHTSLPWLYANDFVGKDTRTHFRANRSRVIFSISGEWY